MNRRFLFVALGALALAIAAYATAALRAPEQPPLAEAMAEDAEPSAQNVDPGVHAEMMRLKAEAEAAPEDLDAQLTFATMALGAHRGADAAEALERAVRAAPEARQPWLDLAQAYAVAEQWDAVVEASERMLVRFPADASAQYNVGAAHANAGRTAQARLAWTAVAAQSEDAPLVAQATASLGQLAAMEAAPEAQVAGGSAPPLAQGQTALPAGHPPIGATTTSDSGARGSTGCAPNSCTEGGACDGTCSGGCGCGGVETRVVNGGAADTRPVRQLITNLAKTE